MDIISHAPVHGRSTSAPNTTANDRQGWYDVAVQPLTAHPWLPSQLPATATADGLFRLRRPRPHRRYPRHLDQGAVDGGWQGDPDGSLSFLPVRRNVFSAPQALQVKASAGQRWRTSDQCERKIGSGGRASMLLVAPPRMKSRMRVWPYAPMTRRSALRDAM
jgi:hypothetical protein